MNNTQLLLTVGMPTLAVLVGILLNQVQVARLDNAIHRLEDLMNQRFDKMQADLHDFYTTQRLQDQRIDLLEGKKRA